MKKRQYIIVGAGAIIFLFILFRLTGGSGGEAPQMNNGKKKVKYVKTKTVVNENHPIVLSGHGRIGSSQNVSLIAEVQGRLLPGDVSLKSGAKFGKGQLLFAIDDVEARLNMQSRKSGFLTMLATALPDLKIDYPEDFELWEDFFEQIDVEKPLPELPKIESVQVKTFLASKNILGEYYSIMATEEQLSKYKVYAPFNGNFIEVITELGTVVNPGSQIAKIIHTGNLEVQVPFSVNEAQFIGLDDDVKIMVEGRENVKGKILRIGQYVNPNTQSVDVFVGIDPAAADKIYDGMYVEVEITAGNFDKVLKITRKAMANGSKLYLVKDSFLISQQVVTVMKDDHFAYVSGVKDGEVVVVEAPANVTDSTIVKTLPQDE